MDPIINCEDQERFGNKSVSEQILRFYRVNRVQQFSFSRPFHRGNRDSDNAFSTLWLERTILTTSHQLPGILRWFPVTESQVFELSPLQTAIEEMEKANRQLTELILSHRADPHLPLHPLTMKLQGIVDAAVNGGINNYEKAFFSDRYLLDHPEDVELVSQLQELFALQIPLIEAALIVHRSRVKQDMQPLQQRIEGCFQQMRSHVESKYGRRDVDPQLERKLAQLARSQLQQRQSGSVLLSVPSGSMVDGGSGGAIHHRLSADVNHHHDGSPSSASIHNNSRLSALSISPSSAGISRQTSGVSLFSRTSSQALGFTFPSTPNNTSGGSSSGISPVKMLTTGHRFRPGGSGVKNSVEKKSRDKENKQHRDSFRRLSSSSAGRGSPFSGLSLAGFGIGSSSSGPSSPAVTGSNTPVLGNNSF